LLGFHFVVNFRQPYLAVGFSDFWRRWHISLSTWLRDYLYIPLGGNRHGERRTYANLFTTMLLGGLWHGANWTFVLWGGLHGAALGVERALGLKGDGQPGSIGASGAQRSAHPTLQVWGKRFLIFHLVCLLWILFRASSIEAAWGMLRGAAHLSWSPIYLTSFGFLVIFSLPLFLLDLRLDGNGEEYPFQKGWQASTRRSYAFKATFGALLLGLTVLMAATESSAFIYFQF
jgi:D-alanyl-lipoteichoic acid acyltransferase DltB (MBOAT superfamily)